MKATEFNSATIKKNQEIAIAEVANYCNGSITSCKYNEKENYFKIRCEVTSKNGNMLARPYVLFYSVRVDETGFAHILAN